MEKRWYVVHAYSGFEQTVKRSLLERIARFGMQEKFGDVLVPTEEVVEMRNGQKRRSDRKFYPGYVLVQIETAIEGRTITINDECWHLVRETPKEMCIRDRCYFGPDRYRRGVWLQQDAGQAWLKMRRAAANDGLPLDVISAFRSLYYQADLLARKRRRGEALAAILSVSAAPGYSEHHSGCAIDLAEIGAPALTEEFADTRSFAWLQQNAHRFGFVMSFPPDNRHGVMYEPWHWCYRPRDTASSASRQRIKKGLHR